MSIEIGNVSYTMPKSLLEDGVNGIKQTPAQPQLGTADLTSILARGGIQGQTGTGTPLSIPGPAGDTANPPPGLGSKLEKMSSMSDIYQIMALFQELSQDARNSARTDRHAQLELRMEQMGQAAQKMRDAATERLIGTCVQAGVQIAASAVTIGISAGSLSSTIKAENMNIQAKSMAAGAEQAKALNLPNMSASLQNSADGLRSASFVMSNKTQQISQICKSAGEIVTASGSIIKGGYEHSAGNKEADKVLHDKQAEMHRLGYDNANEVMQQMRDLIRDLQSKLAELDRSTSETNKQITRI